jgi:2-polyprenyl-3-methyl-5-hydroxy-6-metoxy-1,4-benzoquinol methylase
MKIFKIIKCPICNYKEYKILIKGKHSNYSIKKIKSFFSSSSNIFIDQIVKCINCNFIYTNPRINKKIIILGYKNTKDKTFISQNKERYITFCNSIKKINKIINIKEEDKLLDVGTADGTFLKVCEKLKLNIEGIEPSKWLVKNGKKKNIKIYQGVFEQHKFKKKYNIIFFWDVLEHTFDLKKTKSKITSLIKKNGYLIVNVPDHDSLARKWLKLNWPFYLNVHLYYFNKESLNNLFKKEFNYICKFPHFQILKLEYIFRRAIFYYPILKYILKIIFLLKINNMRIKYNMGQTTYIFKKK